MNGLMTKLVDQETEDKFTESQQSKTIKVIKISLGWWDNVVSDNNIHITGDQEREE